MSMVLASGRERGRDPQKSHIRMPMGMRAHMAGIATLMAWRRQQCVREVFTARSKPGGPGECQMDVTGVALA